MLNTVAIGARVSMTPREADELAQGAVRLVTCQNGKVIGGVGSVGLCEHAADTDLLAFIEEINTKRAALAQLAAGPQPENPRANLFTFIRIG